MAKDGINLQQFRQGIETYARLVAKGLSLDYLEKTIYSAPPKVWNVKNLLREDGTGSKLMVAFFDPVTLVLSTIGLRSSDETGGYSKVNSHYCLDVSLGIRDEGIFVPHITTWKGYRSSEIGSRLEQLFLNVEDSIERNLPFTLVEAFRKKDPKLSLVYRITTTFPDHPK